MHGIVGTVDTVGGEVCQECQECHAKFCMAKLTNLTNLKRDDFANFAKLVMQKICFALSTLFALLRGESAESANSARQKTTKMSEQRAVTLLLGLGWCRSCCRGGGRVGRFAQHS